MPEGERLVSVVIPAFNAGHYLADALRSVQAQTYEPIEIIVVDDGSTDNTAAVAAGFGPGVHCFSMPHAGAGAARNAGIARARGELIAFLDADDIWSPPKLVRQVAALAADPTLDLVFGQIEHYYSPELDETERRSIRLPAGPLPGLLPSTLLVRRSACARVGAFETGVQVGEFVGWFLRAREEGLRWAVQPEVVAQRRVHKANTARISANHRADYVRILKASLDRKRATVA